MKTKLWIVKESSERFRIFKDGPKPKRDLWRQYRQIGGLSESFCTYGLKRLFPSKTLPLVKDGPVRMTVEIKT